MDNKIQVKFFDFNEAPSSLKSQWIEATHKVVSSGQFIGGSYVAEFEEGFANYLGTNHVVGVGNGFDALVLALKVLGVGEDDFVAVPAHTFIATWWAVVAVGATPIGIDCDNRGLMNLDILEKSNHKFKAVMPVHIHGQMVDMRRLMNWANKHSIYVIEDCAQAHGASLENKKAGTWGHVNAFSFYPTTNLGALGDAGAIATSNSELALRARSIGNYGSKPNNKYFYQQYGVNSRLDPIQAAILTVNLKYLDSWNKRRQEIAEKYNTEVKSLGYESLETTESVWHHFILKSKNQALSQKELLKLGIGTDLHYPTCAQNTYFDLGGLKLSNSPKATTLAHETISLPISQWMKDESVQLVIDALNNETVRRSFQVGK